MTPLLEQFLSETREVLQGIGEALIGLEQSPDDAALMGELFRLIHTLKGNSGLFDFPELTRVLHAGEDLLDAVRGGRVGYSQALANQLLEAMDFVEALCDEIEEQGSINAQHGTVSVELAAALRAPLTPASTEGASADPPGAPPQSASTPAEPGQAQLSLQEIPSSLRKKALEQLQAGQTLHWLRYVPAEECFYQGDDPFFTARQTPGLLWGRIVAREPWPPLPELDAYRCVLSFEVLAAAYREELAEHYRYVVDQVQIEAVEAQHLEKESPSQRRTKGQRPATEDGAHGSAPAVGEAPGQASAPETRPLATHEAASALRGIFAVQRQILAFEDRPAWQAGRLSAAARTLINGCRASGDVLAQSDIEAALEQCLRANTGGPLLAWLDARLADGGPAPSSETDETRLTPSPPADQPRAAEHEAGVRFGRRAEDRVGSKHLKVSKDKVDRLMNLIGEMVVSKNALPYLAQRAETQYGVRELARELQAQYAVINRIAEEMQDAIMQVCMMSVSTVFQRFPRLVRDTSNKLGKEVKLVLEGEDTEADKNIIESLADPLIHIVRNSLDHGLETPEVRRSLGKPDSGTLTIRAKQEADRVRIEIHDDGRGIDPNVIKRKAYERGLIDEAALERLTDQEAISLIFTAGFSTADVVTDLSGRGVGMDVVRTAIEKINGTINLESEVGRGTRISLSLPLSMAVTQIMIVESDRQLFGMPMDQVVETVRIPRHAIRTIKRSQTTVLRGRIIPLRNLNSWLKLPAEPLANDNDELAVLVVRSGGEPVGLVLDDFRGTADVIQKPLEGVLAGLAAFSGSALMGDGSVLMVLDPKEIV